MVVQHTHRASRHAAKFPNAIREYRLKASLSQRKLAEIVGRGRNAISSWERGLTQPTATMVVRLAKALGTLAEALYHEFYSPAANVELPTDSPKA